MNKRISTIFAILIIALALVGVSYACWNKTLAINGYVNTGKLDVLVTSVGTDDEPLHYRHVPGHPDGDDPGLQNGHPVYYSKDVGWCIAFLDPSDPTGETLNITISNAYPSYYPSVHFTVSNYGTVPVKYNGSKIISGNLSCLSIDTGNSLGEQIDPYPEYIPASDITYHRDYTIHIHILQPALDNYHVYTFQVKLLFVQWNDYPYHPP
jgi:hypothetical protein